MENIKVTNKARKPVSFMALGHSVRLGPGESVELPGYCREAPELKKLCLRESLSVTKKENEHPGREPGDKTVKEEEKKARTTDDTVEKKAKEKEPGKSPKTSVKSPKKKTKKTGGAKKPLPVEEK